MNEQQSTIATLLVGAEGAAEIAVESWQRGATEEERLAFVAEKCSGDEQLFRNSLVDETGRPYWLLTVLDNAPAEVQTKAKRYARCIRVTD
jgi:hypothetical protein